MTKEKNEENFCNIVALTVHTIGKIKFRGFSIGMKDLMPKPIEFNTLEKLIFLYFYKLTEEEFKK